MLSPNEAAWIATSGKRLAGRNALNGGLFCGFSATCRRLPSEGLAAKAATETSERTAAVANGARHSNELSNTGTTASATPPIPRLIPPYMPCANAEPTMERT